MRIAIDEIEPEMILSAPVINRYGQVLLAAGVTLTERHKTIFKTWGIQSVSVEGEDEEDPDSQLTDELLARGKARIQNRLVTPPQHPREKEIIELAIRQAAQCFLHEDQTTTHGTTD